MLDVFLEEQMIVKYSVICIDWGVYSSSLRSHATDEAEVTLFMLGLCDQSKWICGIHSLLNIHSLLRSCEIVK